MRLLFLQQWLPDEVLKAIGWTLIHSLWQGLLAAVLAGIIIICTRKSEARLRYNLLGVILVLFVVTTIITYSQELKNRVVPGKILTTPGASVAEISLTTANYEADPGHTGRTAIDKFAAYFNSNAGLFVLVWATFFLFHCIKLVTGVAGIQRIRNYRTHVSPAEWQVKLNHLSQLLGIRQSVRLLQSELVKVPVAIGFFKPVILVPLGLLSHLPPEQVETILLHELGHVRRKDYLVNILQRFAEAVFFFNPAILWISSLARQEREACCDDIVVANTTHKGSYLEALVSFQEYSLTTSGYAMAIGSKRHYLLNRIKRMIMRENKKLDIMEKILLVIGMTAFTAFTFIPKNERTDKKNYTVVSTLKEPVELKTAPVTSLRVPASPRKPIVKRENKKAVLVVTVEVPPIDTVPPPAKKEKEKTGYDNLKLLNVSSNVNNDGKTKTETTTVTAQDGKNYTFTKLNNKVTSLSIDGKPIPENEIDNYSQLFDKIEMARQEHRAMRLKDRERRKADMAKRVEDNKTRIAEHKKLMAAEREKRKEFLKSKEVQMKRENREKERINRERDKMIRLKQIEKNGKKIIVPTINGREVVNQNSKTENMEVTIQNKYDANLQKKTDVSIQDKADINMQKKKDVNIENKPEFNLQEKVDVDEPNKSIANHNAIKLNQFPLRLDNKGWQPAKPDWNAPPKEAQPAKPKKSFEFGKKRVTT